MTTAGFIILVVLFFAVAMIYVQLASMPGKKARELGNPQATAIQNLSWFGLMLCLVPGKISMEGANRGTCRLTKIDTTATDGVAL